MSVDNKKLPTSQLCPCPPLRREACSDAHRRQVAARAHQICARKRARAYILLGNAGVRFSKAALRSPAGRRTWARSPKWSLTSWAPSRLPRRAKSMPAIGESRTARGALRDDVVGSGCARGHVSRTLERRCASRIQDRRSRACEQNRAGGLGVDEPRTSALRRRDVKGRFWDEPDAGERAG